MSGKCTVAYTAFKAQAKAIKKNLKSLQDGDADAIHDTRVASRRLRAVLTEFKDVFDPDLEKSLRKKTKTITRKLGQARELDVSIELLKSFPEDPAAAQVDASLQERRKAEDKNVAKAADIAGSDKFQKRLRTLTDAAKGDSCRIRQARMNPAKRFEAVVETYKAWQSDASPDQLHKLRIAFKKLRYTTEIYTDLYDKDMKDFMKSLKEVQELLGQWHDHNILLADIQQVKPADDSLAKSVEQKEQALLHDFKDKAAQFFKQSKDPQKIFSTAQHCPH